MEKRRDKIIFIDKKRENIYKNKSHTRSCLCLWYAHFADDDNVFIECLVLSSYTENEHTINITEHKNA